MPEDQLTFGPFVLDGRRATVLHNGKPIAISSRGFVLLQVLAEADGRAVTKAELMDAAWPNATVEQSNLTVQVAALRKALGQSSPGEEWIATVPRVGYRLNRPSLAEPPSASGGKPSIAVLPFDNLSSDPEQEYFAVGLAEDLITDLSKVPGLMVIARSSSFAYAGKPSDVRLVAKQLGVRYVIEGSVRRAANRVRINAELVDAADNSHLWADRFDRELADVFTLQDDVVGKILSALLEVLPSASIVPTRRATNLKAHDLFARGRVLMTQLSEDNKAARPFLEQSIAIDSDFAEAHAWPAISHHFALAYWGEPIEPHHSLARSSADRAVSNDSESAVAHGDVLIYEHKPDEGAAELESALRIDPNPAALLFLRLTLAAIAATARWCNNRQAIYSLGRANPAMLRDLGIARSGIESAVRHGRA